LFGESRHPRAWRRHVDSVSVKFFIGDDDGETIGYGGDTWRSLVEPGQPAELIKPGFINAKQAGGRFDDTNCRISFEQTFNSRSAFRLSLETASHFDE